MSRPFTILHYDLDAGRGARRQFSSPEESLGGSGLAAALYEEYGLPSEPPFHPAQPVIFAVGPLTGYFPLMSKVVCAFCSPYTGEYAESHAGGRLALSLRMAGYDALVITGRAKSLSVLVVGGRHMEMHDVHFLAGVDALSVGKHLRRYGHGASGHRSTLRIGPAGENLVETACINVDTYRHFGRLGGGAALGAKRLKAVIVLGDSPQAIPEGKEYPALFKDIHAKLTTTDMMDKYHNLGTPENLLVLNGIKALPWRNLQQTSDPGVEGISGERFAEQLLLRKTACSGCPVGCIHIGLLREMFAAKHDYLYRQVAYDYEPLFSCGSMLGLTAASDVLAVMDECERQGLDVMSAGVALAWATEALQKGVVSEEQTLLPLSFGDAAGFRQGMVHLGQRTNEFWRLLGAGALKAAAVYGGADFACVLGQEMAGYATGEVFFVAEALGFRHSHLDAGGYSYDQKAKDKDAAKAVEFLVKDERQRVMITCMVACLFSRAVYTPELVQDALRVLGYGAAADNLDALAADAQARRWKLKLDTGYHPDNIRIPKRFLEVETWKGRMDPEFLSDVRARYAKAILGMAARLPE
jgi:aldehyde:ferredoxin oxidoreductase